MAKRLQRIKAPTFTKGLLDLADLCARDLWRGVNYETGKKQEIVGSVVKNSRTTVASKRMSDEDIMNIFATPFYKKVSNLKTTFSIPTQSIEDFISIGKLYVVNTRKSNIDYQKGIAVIDSEIAKRYKGWNLENTEKNYSEIGIELIKKLSEGIFTASSLQQDGNHYALASRILFFTIPDLPIYNISAGIMLGMKLNDEPDEMLTQYVNALQDGLERNWSLLSEYQMPYPTILDEVTWKRARDSGWWQRRVLDLALKFYFSENKKGKKELKVNDLILELFMTTPQTH